jgi:hypothetical protein
MMNVEANFSDCHFRVFSKNWDKAILFGCSSLSLLFNFRENPSLDFMDGDVDEDVDIDGITFDSFIIKSVRRMEVLGVLTENEDGESELMNEPNLKDVNKIFKSRNLTIIVSKHPDKLRFDNVVDVKDSENVLMNYYKAMNKKGRLFPSIMFQNISVTLDNEIEFADWLRYSPLEISLPMKDDLIFYLSKVRKNCQATDLKIFRIPEKIEQFFTLLSTRCLTITKVIVVLEELKKDDVKKLKTGFDFCKQLEEIQIFCPSLWEDQCILNNGWFLQKKCKQSNNS